MAEDARSRQVAVVEDVLLPGAIDVLEEERWGVIQLPPDGLDEQTVQLWLEQVAEHVAEFRRNGYALVLISDGRHDRALADALRAIGVDELPPRAEPTREDLSRSGFQSHPAR